MAFVTLKKQVKKAERKPMVSITKDALRFNKAAVEEFELDGFGHAEVQRDDQDESKLAVKLLKEPTEESNKLSRGVISATALIEPYGLKQGSYELKVSQEENVLELVEQTNAA